MQSAALSCALQIFPAQEKDAPVVRTLAHRIWPVCFKGVLTPEQIANMLERIYEVESLHRQMREGHCFFIAYLGHEPIGYASAYADGEHLWLKKIYFDTTSQGQGFGTAMIETITKAFPEQRDIRLLVNRANHAAHAFYARCGFARIGEVPVRMGDFAFVDYLYNKPLLGQP